MDCCGRGGLRFGHIGASHSALFGREPAIACDNPPLSATTRYCVRQPAMLHANPLFRAWARPPILHQVGERADQRAKAAACWAVPPTCRVNVRGGRSLVHGEGAHASPQAHKHASTLGAYSPRTDTSAPATDND